MFIPIGIGAIMLVRDQGDCYEFLAGDETHLRELLHPNKESLHIRYSLAHAYLKPGEASLPHKLRSSEVYYILEGEGIMFINDESSRIASGHTIYVPPNAIQHVRNTGANDLKFLCIVDPAWRGDDEELVDTLAG